MADTNSTKAFTAAGGSLYYMNKAASQLDIIDQLSASLGQLTAMLVTVTGEGLENFRALSQENQDYYLWACQSLSVECSELVLHLSHSPRSGDRQGSALACLEAMRQLEADAKDMPEDPRAWLLKRLTDSERLARSVGPLTPEAEGAILALAEYIHYANTTGLPNVASGAWKPVAAMSESEMNEWVSRTEKQARENASGPRTKES